MSLHKFSQNQIFAIIKSLSGNIWESAYGFVFEIVQFYVNLFVVLH